MKTTTESMSCYETVTIGDAARVACTATICKTVPSPAAPDIGAILLSLLHAVSIRGRITNANTSSTRPFEPGNVEGNLYRVEVFHGRSQIQNQSRAFALYEEFRPEIPAGTKGWGAKGELDLDRIDALAKKAV